MRKLLSIILALSLLLGTIPASLADEAGAVDEVTEGADAGLQDQSALPEEPAAETPASEAPQASEEKQNEEPEEATTKTEAVPPSAESKDNDSDKGSTESDKSKEPASEDVQVKPQDAQAQPLDQLQDAQDQPQEAQNPAAAESDSEKQDKPSAEDSKADDKEAGAAAEKTPEVSSEKKDADQDEEDDIVVKLTPKYLPGAGVVPTLKVENPTATTLKLTWTTPSSGADGYEMTLSKSSDFSSPVTRETTNTYYNVSGLSCGTTYYYRVRAYLLDSGVKAWGEYKTISYRTSPTPPASLTATQDGATSVKLTWPSVSEADGYILTINGSTLATITSKTTTTYTHKNVEAYEDLQYRVYSYKNVDGSRIQSADYAEAIITELTVPVPTGLTITSQGNDSVKLTWDKIDGVQYYQIRRKSESEFENLAQVSTTTYTDTGLLFGKEYAYTVTAYINSSFHSDPCTPVLGQATGAPPKNVKAASGGADSITVSWDKVENANGYRVEGSDSKSGPWTSLYEDVQTSFTETGLTMGQGRYYRVSAYVFINSTKVYTSPSDVVFDAVRPVAPELNVENEDYNKQLVTWNNLGSGVKYEFQLSTNSSFSSPVIRNTGSANYLVTGCTNATTYYYRVRGYVELDGGKTLVYGPFSKVVSLQCAPAQSTSISVTKISGQESNVRKITWAAVNGATSYNVYSKKDDGSWTQIGTTTSPTVTFTAKNLSVGSKYFFAVSAVRTADGKTAVGQKAISSEVEISINDYTPVNFSDTAISSTSIKVSWKNFTGISTYEVEGASDDDSTFSLEQTVSTNSITLTGLKVGYVYKIRARSKVVVNNQDLYSPWSSWYSVQAKTLGPSSLSLTSAYAAYAVSVDWTTVKDADGYIIERSQYKEGPYTVIKDIGDGNASHYGDYNFSASDCGKTFFYRVCSYVNAMGSKQKSAYTGPKQVLMTMPKPKVTAKPQNMGRINLSWTDLGADRYEVHRSTSSGSGYKLIATVTGTSYSDAGGLKFGTVYYYKVRGVKTVAGTTVVGYLSDYVSAEPKTVAPTITSTTANGGSVTIKWSKAAGATSYNVYYHVDGGSWKKAGNTTKLTYTVTGLTPETKYFFKVASVAKASNGRTVEGLFSAETSITTKTTVVGKVTGTNRWVNSLTSIVVTWAKVPDATGYEVQIATYIVSTAGMGPWHNWTTSTTNRATVSGLLKNKTYWIRVRAYVDQGGVKSYGPWSDPFTGYSAPIAPKDVKVASTAKTTATLTWTAASGAAGYRIWYGTNKNSLSVYRDIVNPSLSSLTVTGLSSGTTYYFKVQPFGTEAADRRLYGTGSTVVNGKTK